MSTSLPGVCAGHEHQNGTIDPASHDEVIAANGAKVKQGTAVKWSSEGERDKERGTVKQSAQRLEVVLLQEPGRL
jgi:hypothetical protein